VISWQEIGAQTRAFGLALGVHLLMAALVVLGTMNWEPFRQPQPQAIAIEAVMVDTSKIREQREEAKKAVEREKLRDDRAEELRKQREREEALKKEQDIKAEQEKKRQADLDEQKKREAQLKLDQLRKEQEKKRAEDLARQQKELEKVRAEAAAAEKKRKEDAEKLKQVEAQRQREAIEKRRKEEEAIIAQKVGEEERAFQAGRQAEKSDEYQAAIQSFVTQNWLRPPTAKAGLRCTLRIVQIPGGEVISASIAGQCNGDEATKRSIIAAVERGGALPYRGFEDVFEREIDFIFIYDGD
jgi:colicin import membrane protein